MKPKVGGTERQLESGVTVRYHLEVHRMMPSSRGALEFKYVEDPIMAYQEFLSMRRDYPENKITIEQTTETVEYRFLSPEELKLLASRK